MHKSLNKATTSETADHQTPEGLVDTIHAHFGGITLDPSTVLSNPTGAERILVPAVTRHGFHHDGLVTPWSLGPFDVTYVNPRYGKYLDGPVRPNLTMPSEGTGWAARIADQLRCGQGLVLVPARPGSQWWRTLTLWSDLVHFFGVRLRFRGQPTGAPFPSAMFYRGPGHGHDLFRAMCKDYDKGKGTTFISLH